jgi:hypothetical protein
MMVFMSSGGSFKSAQCLVKAELECVLTRHCNRALICVCVSGLQEDWIGLKDLDERGRIEFKEVPGGHMHFSLDWCAGPYTLHPTKNLAVKFFRALL